MNDELIAEFNKVVDKIGTLGTKRATRLDKDNVLSVAKADSDTAHVAEAAALTDLQDEAKAFKDLLDARVQ